jgi:hypothetical protein
MKSFWLVGQYKAATEAGVVWEFQGAFASREEAVAACRTAKYFITEVPFGESLPHDTIHPTEFVYPRAEL